MTWTTDDFDFSVPLPSMIAMGSGQAKVSGIGMSDQFPSFDFCGSPNKILQEVEEEQVKQRRIVDRSSENYLKVTKERGGGGVKGWKTGGISILEFTTQIKLSKPESRFVLAPQINWHKLISEQIR